MALEFTPNSYRLTAASSSWVDILDKLRSEISAGNNSTKFDVKQFNDDTGTSGDYGVTLTPKDTSESWDVNIRFDASVPDVYILIDPDGAVSNPLAPDTSSPASNETHGLGQGVADPGVNTEFLVAEWFDAMFILFKDSTDDHFPWSFQFGRLIEPFYSNDPSRNLDGLAISGKQPAAGDGKVGHAWGGSSAEVRIPGGWTANATAPVTHTEFNSSVGSPWPSGDETPKPITITDKNNGDHHLGILKYFYAWHTAGGDTGLESLTGASGDGFLFSSFDGSAHTSIVPWDPNVTLT